ncbi:unnamed protein product [Tuber melanosporum]|uniref:beta-glucosidase n=1 Tax=Tuber melanosporum (strain Mel28) TaxID=656061 RepID=D5GFU6_TUBMM|nr:uncharacterized protein GSTUM_00007084001 [Tuber melanosporum]CAZ83389.1 unnamed protein product [Tuber melanosporum]
MVTRIVATWYKFGQDDGHPEPNFSSWTKNTTGLLYYGSNEPPYAIVNKHVEARGDHATLARKIAAEAIAMLKNEDVLPLQKPMKVGVYGSDAGPGDGPNACPDRGCNQGTLAVGWGSGATDFEYLITPLEAIEKQVGTYGGQVSSVLNNTKLDEIKADAKKQDICLAFVNADAGEGYISWQDVNGDRPNLKTQLGGDDLISAVAEACKATVVVVHSVGPIIMEDWVRSHKVDGILWAHLPGQESGNSLVDVLWGAVNPSGKLPYTIGKSLEDYGPTAGVLYESNGNPPQQDFTEGLLIDYRYFDKKDITPRYEFGFGMSYTTFEFSDLNIVRTGSMEPLPKPRPAPEGGNPALWEIVYTITHTLKNTGKVAGAEVSQLYVNYGSKDTVKFPERVLRGFEKVFLEPGESKTVTFKLTRRDLSYWDVTKQNWVIPSGGLGVCIGQSSRKFHLRGNLRYGY